MNTYVTADHHFWHKNIIEYCGRPFRTVEGMNFALLQRWNATVQPDDLVIHLGDVCLCVKKEAREIISRLNGHKALILGNHDRFNRGAWKDLGFFHIAKKFQIYKVLMTHKPQLLLEPGVTNVHGHSHDFRPHKYNNHINVSVEVTAYRPVLLRDLIGDLEEGVTAYYKEMMKCP